MHSDVVNDVVDIFWQRIDKLILIQDGVAPCGEFKMASRHAVNQNGVARHAMNLKCRPLFAASAPGRGEGG